MAAPALEPTADAVTKLAWVHEVLGSIATSEYSTLPGGRQREAAGQLARLKARATAHELAAVAAVESSGTARRQGASSTGSLLAGDFGGDRRGADAVVKQAKRSAKTPRAHEAMAAGDITPKQARVIEQALDQLPDDVTPEAREACETQLVDDAPRFDLPTLMRQADRIVASFTADADDPDALDEAENDLVEAREKRAWDRAEFWMGGPIDGRVQGGFTIPEAQAAALRTALDALCAPQVELSGPGDVSRRTGEVLLDERPSYRTRQGWAFTHLCELLPTDRLPETNNLGPVLTINLDHDVLIKKLKVASLATGERISAGQARQMACDNRLLPAVFGGESLPLDLGRSKRLFTLHQRRALELRDKGCVFPGLGVPPQKAHSGGGRQAAGLDRRPPRPNNVGRGWRHRPRRRSPALPASSPDPAPRRMGHPIRPRRGSGVHSTARSRSGSSSATASTIPIRPELDGRALPICPRPREMAQRAGAHRSAGGPGERW